MFDLNKAISEWRARLRSSETMGGEDLEELEAHLREDTETLVRRGLAEEEAFWLAARRIGPPAQVAVEYANGNPSVLWRHRAKWMVVGVLGYIGLTAFGGLASNSGWLAATWFRLQPEYTATAAMALRVVAFVAGLLVLFAVQRGWLAPIAKRLSAPRALFLSGVLLVLLTLGARAVAMACNVLTLRIASAEVMGETVMVLQYGELVALVLAPLCWVTVAYALWRKPQQV